MLRPLTAASDDCLLFLVKKFAEARAAVKIFLRSLPRLHSLPPVAKLGKQGPPFLILKNLPAQFLSLS